MASFILAAGVFPVGATVSVYLARNFSSDTPSGSVVTSATTAADTTTTLTGLADDTAYVAGAQINGAWRKIGFRTAPDFGNTFDGVLERLAALEASEPVARVVAPSTPSSTVTLDLDGDAAVWKTYVLSAATTTLNFDNPVAGATVELWIIQPASGAKTFAISDGTDDVTVDISTEADEMTHVRVSFLDTDDLRVDIVGSGPAPAVPAAPFNVVAPAITGVAETGETLTCSTGTWTGVPTPTYARQWKNAGVAIGGATGTTYVLQAGDVGDAITCTVTATNSSGSVSANSNTVTPVPPTPYRTAVLASPSVLDYWPMGETSGSTAADLVGSNDHPLTIGDNVILGESPVVATQVTTSMRPNPSNTSDVEGYLAGATAVSAYPLTVIVWVNVVAGSQSGAFVNVGGDNNGIAVGIGGATIDNDGTDLVGAVGGVAHEPTGFALTAGIHMIAVTSTTGQQKYYVDGALVFTGSRTPIAPTATIQVGGYFNRIADGNKIGHVSLHNAVLTLGNIQTLYDAGTS